MIFCQSQRCVKVFTCTCHSRNSRGWDDHRKKVSNDESKNNPRERMNKQGVNGAGEVWANRMETQKLHYLFIFDHTKLKLNILQHLLSGKLFFLSMYFVAKCSTMSV
jgi:hypothetical protein